MEGLLTDIELKLLLEGMETRWVVFCEEYIKHNNATRAAIAAGYKDGSGINVTASRLLTKTNISTYVNHLKAKRSIKNELTADRILKEYAKIAFSSLSDFVDVDDEGKVKIKSLEEIGDLAAGLKSIETINLTDAGEVYGQVTKLTREDKLKALEALARHHALFTDNVNLTGSTSQEKIIKQEVTISINHRSKNQTLTDEKPDET